MPKLSGERLDELEVLHQLVCMRCYFSQLFLEDILKFEKRPRCPEWGIHTLDSSISMKKSVSTSIETALKDAPLGIKLMGK